MKRPWEILSAGIVLGELIILTGGPLRAAGAGLAALLLMLFFRRFGPAALRFPRVRLAAALFSAAAAAGMLRMAAAQVRRSLVSFSPWGLKESDTTERLHFHFLLSHIGEGNGNPLQCSCLENPRDEGAWWAAVYGVVQSQTRLK